MKTFKLKLRNLHYSIEAFMFRFFCKASYDRCNGCEDYGCWKMYKQKRGK